MNRERLRRELVELREGLGATEAKFIDAQAIKQALGVVDAFSARAELQARILRRTGPEWDALRNAYGFVPNSAEKTTWRREDFATEHGISVDTVKRRESKAIDELAAILLEGDDIEDQPAGGIVNMPRGRWLTVFSGLGSWLEWNEEEGLYWSTRGRRPGRAELVRFVDHNQDTSLNLTFLRPTEPGVRAFVAWQTGVSETRFEFRIRDVHYPPFVRLNVDGNDVHVPDGTAFALVLQEPWERVELDWWWHGQRSNDWPEVK